jgi:hypothetical protein
VPNDACQYCYTGHKVIGWAPMGPLASSMAHHRPRLCRRLHLRPPCPALASLVSISGTRAPPSPSLAPAPHHLPRLHLWLGFRQWRRPFSSPTPAAIYRRCFGGRQTGQVVGTVVRWLKGPGDGAVAGPGQGRGIVAVRQRAWP